MKKKNIAIIMMLLLALLIGAISWEYYNASKIKENTELKKQVINMVQNSKEIDFSKVTDFKWDTLYLFGPYTDTKTVLRKDRVKNYKNDLDMQYNDGMNIIAFVDSKKIVTYIKINSIDMEFEYTNDGKTGYDKSTFKITNNDGDYTLSLKQ